MITTLPGLLDTKPGSAGKPLPGIEAAVVDEEGKDAGTDQGYLILKRPWPAMLRTLYKEDDRFVETYWDKFGKDVYLVGDAARRDEDGYFWIIGRIDDVVNVSGHRLSTAEVESAIVSHAKVAEAAVIGQADEDTGQAITAFVTLEGDDDEGTDELIDEIRERVASRIGKFARPKRIIWAGDLPKTRSRQDHAPPAARHRRGPRARRRHDAARPRRDEAARGQDQGAPGRRGVEPAVRVAVARPFVAPQPPSVDPSQEACVRARTFHAKAVRSEERRAWPDWEAIERSDEFRELVAKRRSFVVPATIFFLAYYMGFILLAGYAPDFMGESVYEGLTVGYCLALTQFLMVFVLGIWYLRKSDREFDPLADKVVAAAAEREGDDVRFVRKDETEVTR